jgi:hypothetical protein
MHLTILRLATLQVTEEVRPHGDDMTVIDPPKTAVERNQSHVDFLLSHNPILIW